MARLLSIVRGGPAVFVVGGTVRDLLLGREPLDLDVVVDGPLTDIVQALGPPLRAHDRFETATVMLGGRALRPGALAVGDLPAAGSAAATAPGTDRAGSAAP